MVVPSKFDRDCPVGVPHTFTVPEYREDREGFYSSLNALADQLEDAGY